MGQAPLLKSKQATPRPQGLRDDIIPAMSAHLELVTKYRNESFDYNREAALRYLKVGGKDQCVHEDELRSWLLLTGHTELALGGLFWGSDVTYVGNDSKKKALGKITMAVHAPNRYSLAVERHDAVAASTFVLRNIYPDCQGKKDNLRETVIDQLGQLNVLRKQLWDDGKKYFSLEAWQFKWEDATVLFLLNPLDQENNQHGWYTLSALKMWQENSPFCPIPRSGSKNPYDTFYHEATDQLANTIEIDRSRLLSIALLACPFPDLVAKHKHLLKI